MSDSEEAFRKFKEDLDSGNKMDKDTADEIWKNACEDFNIAQARMDSMKGTRCIKPNPWRQSDE